MQQLTRGVHVKLGLFVLVALLGTSYLGASYVGFTPFSDGYRVTVALPEAGGLFVHSEVTYRGVQVGKVTAMEPTGDGVEVTAEIEPDAPDIPADATARVRNRSSIGEQYLDLAGTSTKDLLADGDHLSGGPEALPQDLSEVLRAGRDLVASVPSDSLDTAIDEGYLLSQGISHDVGRLVETSREFQQAADDNFLVSASLIRNADRVLATQEDSSAAIGAYSKDLALFSQALADSDADLRTLVAATPGAAEQLSLLIRDVGQPLSILMDNLVSTATIFGANAAGVRDSLIRLPQAVSVGWATTSGRGFHLGMVPTFFNPLPCTTGYSGTTLRRGTDATEGPPLNRKAGCTAPRGEGNVRGPQAVAGGTGDGTAQRPADVDVVEDLDDLLGGGR
ncbi:MlaD family protein [Pimelobacter simplex]|uniref:MlaD family protein n=1 Tax=Nocardioides simplex TaxID=2045 RepID=UPI0019333BF5|nr:MCE family protein [Pimelobacter simplex]